MAQGLVVVAAYSGGCRPQGGNRKSNLELLRLIAIFAILASHYFYGTGIRAELSGQSLLVANFLASGARIAVNVFVLLGTWFLVDLPFKGLRPLRLYFTLAFYSIPITITMLLIGQPLCMQQVLQGLFPFTFMATWYTNAYISMLLFSPFLHRLLRMPKAQLQIIAILILSLVCFPASLPWMTIDDYVSNMLWFPCLYVLVGYFKHHTHAFEWGSTWWYACVAIVGYVLIVICRNSPFPQIATMDELYRGNIKTLPNLLIAYCTFVVFLRLRIGTHKWINRLAQSVFSVYVIHQIPAFSGWQWNMVRRYLQPMTGTAPIAIIVNCLVSCACMIAIIFLLDQVKLLIVDFWFMNTTHFKRIAEFIEHSVSPRETNATSGA